MENRKSPGMDGIPIDFYKEFLETIILDLLKTFNETLFTNKKTPKTWNQAIITLIPKKGNIKLLKYWRLLCVDYKIFTKILANGLRHILPQIILDEQNCSIPNNHLYLLQIDQEKAFDKVDRNFLYKTLEKIGISPILINFGNGLASGSCVVNTNLRVCLFCPGSHLPHGLVIRISGFHPWARFRFPAQEDQYFSMGSSLRSSQIPVPYVPIRCGLD